MVHVQVQPFLPLGKNHEGFDTWFAAIYDLLK